MECILTNLDEKDFPIEEIKRLYGWRWGIERSFRELKYTIGLTNFHAKKVEYILQEIFARLTIYNFCERIITTIAIQQKNRKYTYQTNFTVAVFICRVLMATLDGNTKTLLPVSELPCILSLIQ